MARTVSTTERSSEYFPTEAVIATFDMLGMRSMAEQGAEHAKHALDDLTSTTQKAFANFDQQAADIRQRSLTIAAKTMANSLEFGQRLMRAKTMQDVIHLQTEFFEEQMRSFADQTRDLGECVAKSAADTMKTAAGDIQSEWNRIEGSWKQVKGKAKEKWGKLTDHDLEEIAGKRDQLEGKIENRYGYARDQIRKDIDAWSRSLRA